MRQVGLRLNAELLARVEAARGEVPREAFVRRALLNHLRRGSPESIARIEAMASITDALEALATAENMRTGSRKAQGAVHREDSHDRRVDDCEEDLEAAVRDALAVWLRPSPVSRSFDEAMILPEPDRKDTDGN